MSNTAMTLFNSASAMPAHVANAFGDAENIVARETTPALTFRGKTWRLRVNGEENVVTRMVDGEALPAQTIQVVVLNLNAKRSRLFYEGAFEEGKNAAPRCWSSNGEAPDADCHSPCAATCAACPNSVKGSKITPNGKETTACGSVKRLAVVPVGALEMEPLLLKVPQTSMWDKNNPEAEAKGYYAWDQYADFLRQRGVKHTAAVVTRIRFDPNVAYPKLLFTAARWLEADEAAKVVPVVSSEAVMKLLAGKINEDVVANAPAVVADEESFEQAAPKPAPKAAPAPKPAPAPVEELWDDEDAPPPVAAAPAPVQAPAPAPAKPKPTAAKPKPAPAPKADPVDEPAAANVQADLLKLASAWDSD